MPGNVFLKLVPQSGKMTGESLQEGHEGKDGWIEISEWDWEVEADTSFTKGTGSAVGKPQPGVFSFSHYYDKSSPTIMNMIVQGMHFKEMHVDMLKQTGSEKGPQLYFQFKARDVFITKVSSKGSEDGEVTQEIECVFKEMALGYKRQLNNGKLDTAIREFKWNIAAMNFDTSGAVAIKM